MRLLLVELTRLRLRRAVVLLLLGLTLLVGFLAFDTVRNTRPLSPEDLAAAEAMAAAEAEQPWVQDELEMCRENPEAYLPPDGGSVTCEEVVLPKPEWYLDRAPLDLASVNQDAGMAVLVLTTGILVLAATTYAGADWASGSMSNQLLFEPRRLRLWLAKAGAVLVGATAFAGVLVAGFWLALLAVARARGIDTPDPALSQVAWTAVRGVVLAAGAALGAYALTMLLRHTVGTLGVLFGYAVGGTILLEVLPLERAGRWSVGNNAFAWLLDGTDVYDPTMPCSPSSDVCVQTFTLTLGQGAAYLGVLVAVVVAASLVAFRRRDVG